MDMNIENLEKEIKELKELIKKQNESTFACVECANQHQQILDWLSELKDYENGKIGQNKENPNTEGYMTIDEANHAVSICKRQEIIPQGLFFLLACAIIHLLILKRTNKFKSI